MEKRIKRCYVNEVIYNIYDDFKLLKWFWICKKYLEENLEYK